MRKVTTKHVDEDYLYDKKLLRDVREALGKDDGWVTLCIKNNTKDGKRHFTKIKRECSGCSEILDMRDTYHRQYGFCNMYCGWGTFGLSARDFY